MLEMETPAFSSFKTFLFGIIPSKCESMREHTAFLFGCINYKNWASNNAQEQWIGRTGRLCRRLPAFLKTTGNDHCATVQGTKNSWSQRWAPGEAIGKIPGSSGGLNKYLLSK